MYLTSAYMHQSSPQIVEPLMQETIMSQEEEKQPPRIRELDISEERIKELCKEMNDLNRRMREVGRKVNQLRSK